MKKTRFMWCFIAYRKLMLCALLVLLLSLLFQLLDKSSQSMNLTSTFPEGRSLLELHYTFYWLGLSLVLISFSLLTLEITQRFKKDRITNLYRSIRESYRLRKFLLQDEQKKTTVEKPSAQALTDTKYNHTVRKLMIDINDKELTLFLRLPKSYQAQRTLKGLEQEIKEELASRYPHYLISTFERNKQALWLKGTKR